MRRHAVWLAVSLVAVLGACDQAPKGPPPLPNSADSSIPEAVPFVEPPANETTTNPTIVNTATVAESTSSPTAAAAEAPVEATTAAPAPIPFGNARDVVATDRGFRARQKRLEGLVDNAVSRDPSGDAAADYQYALPERDRCGSRGCLTAWYARQEAALSKWEGAAEILAQPPP
jgi:hypothetical protein